LFPPSHNDARVDARELGRMPRWHGLHCTPRHRHTQSAGRGRMMRRHGLHCTPRHRQAPARQSTLYTKPTDMRATTPTILQLPSRASRNAHREPSPFSLPANKGDASIFLTALGAPPLAPCSSRRHGARVINAPVKWPPRRDSFSGKISVDRRPWWFMLVYSSRRTGTTQRAEPLH
jgi:hypothetical protein